MCIFFCGNPQTTKWIELQVQRACRRAHQLCPVNPHQDSWHESPAELAQTPATEGPLRLDLSADAPRTHGQVTSQSSRSVTESAETETDGGLPAGRAVPWHAKRLALYEGADPFEERPAKPMPADPRLVADPDFDDGVLCPACHRVALAEARYCDLCGEPLWLATTAAGSAAERGIRFVARGAMMVAFALFAACLMSFLLPPHSQFGLVLAIVAFAGFLLARQSICCLAEPARDPAGAPAPSDAAPS